MQTGGISSQNQWARFIQLSSMARMRNQGLSTAPTVVGRTVSTPATPTSPSVSNRAPAVTGSPRSYASVRAATPARILGGTFDAYA